MNFFRNCGYNTPALLDTKIGFEHIFEIGIFKGIKFCLSAKSFKVLAIGIDFFNDFSNFYCFAVKICVRDVISAFRSIAWRTSLKKMTFELVYKT